MTTIQAAAQNQLRHVKAKVACEKTGGGKMSYDDLGTAADYDRIGRAHGISQDIIDAAKADRSAAKGGAA